MKKWLSILLAIVALFSLTLNVAATEVTFVDSIINKGAPDVIIEVNEEGDSVIGEIVNADGDVISEEEEEHIIITSVSDAETSTDIPEDAKELLQDLYEEFNEPGTKLSELFPELDEILPDDMDADDLVVRDLFDITAVCDDLKTELPKDGNTIDLSFKVSLGKEQPIYAMVYVDGKWTVVPKIVNNGDGTVTVTFDQLGPVAFLVPAAGGTSSPTTGESHTDLIVWGSVLAISAAALVVLAVLHRRKSNG